MEWLFFKEKHKVKDSMCPCVCGRETEADSLYVQKEKESECVKRMENVIIMNWFIE